MIGTCPSGINLNSRARGRQGCSQMLEYGVGHRRTAYTLRVSLKLRQGDFAAVFCGTRKYGIRLTDISKADEQHRDGLALTGARAAVFLNRLAHHDSAVTGFLLLVFCRRFLNGVAVKVEASKLNFFS